jgi:Rod binding domain-containing protein
VSLSIASLAGNEAARPIIAPQIKGDDGEVRRAFDQFVGETFYGQMLKSMRATVGKPAYFHGGKAEEMFTTQLDQVLAEQLTKASAHTFTGPMYELFNLQRS